MNFKVAIMAAVLAAGISTAGSAQEAVDNGGFDGRLNDWSFSSPVNSLASRAARVGVVDTALSGPGALFQVLSLGVGTYTFSFDGLFNGNSRSGLLATIYNSSVGQVFLQAFNGSAIRGSKSFEFEVKQAGDYELLFTGTARGGLASFIAVDNVSVSAVPVPGPEAGAGLAGLAMAGMYMWASRRRKALAAA